MNLFKKKYQLILIIALWFSLSVITWFKPTSLVSYSERRPLRQFPVVSIHNVLSGFFMQHFEAYALDQFPFRESFRTLKAFSDLYIFNHSNTHGIHVIGDHLVSFQYPMNDNALQRAINQLNQLYNLYLSDTQVSLYLSVIPDKGYFLGKEDDYLNIDYSKFIYQITTKMPFATYIDLFPVLSLDDYYTTDTHWRQENLLPIAEFLLSSMGNPNGHLWNYHLVNTELPFYGIYHSQSALPSKPDALCYWTNSKLESLEVYHIHSNLLTPVYDLEKLSSFDSYNFFLSGASPLLVIENPNASTEKELIIFRDSFASSLSPLLFEGYAKTILIDLRYMSESLISEYIQFENQDVFFLYSAIVLNGWH